MGNKPSAGMKLRCKDGHWEWGEFELRPVDGGVGGYEMMVHCDYGEHHGHWLAPDAPSGDPQRVIATGVPYAWPLATEAFAARDRYGQQVARDFA